MHHWPPSFTINHWVGHPPYASEAGRVISASPEAISVQDSVHGHRSNHFLHEGHLLFHRDHSFLSAAPGLGTGGATQVTSVVKNNGWQPVDGLEKRSSINGQTTSGQSPVIIFNHNGLSTINPNGLSINHRIIKHQPMGTMINLS